MVKEFTYRGKKMEELKNMSHNELAKILPARQRRKIKRGLNDEHKKILSKVDKIKEGKIKKIKTHRRDMMIFPKMVGIDIQVYNGKEFVNLSITPEMIGRYLGEFVLPRTTVKHSAPGVGATRSSAHLSVK